MAGLGDTKGRRLATATALDQVEAIISFVVDRTAAVRTAKTLVASRAIGVDEDHGCGGRILGSMNSMVRTPEGAPGAGRFVAASRVGSS